MNRNALIVVLCLLSRLAHGTFELEGPAAKVIEDLENDARRDATQQGDAYDNLNESASRDIGSAACSDFLSFRQQPPLTEGSSLYWLQRFINRAGCRQTSSELCLSSDADLESMALWIENYCRENPSDQLAQAAEAIVEENSGLD
jgi:hypothetical protein